MSLHFLVAALRRRWVACVVVALVGLLAAAGYLLVSPPSHAAKTTLILSHDPQLDPTRAMSTDVALLDTRTVAAETVAKLGLDMTPEDFRKTLTVVQISSELLSIELNAPTGDEAVRRLDTLSSTYLDFRAQQLTLQSNSTVQGLQKQIDDLNAQVKTLSQRIEQLSATAANSSELGDAISQRANAQGRIDTLTQSIEDAELKTSSIVSSSRVVDPAAVEPGLALRGLALGLASGLIGGLALGCGTVLFFAIVSDRIRRRSDVAEALGVPVTISVGRLTPLSPGLQRLPFLRSVERRRATDRERLAHAITAQLNTSGRRSIGIACVDNVVEVGHAVATAAAELSARGEVTVVIDLSDQGAVDQGAIDQGAIDHTVVDQGHSTLGGGVGPATILRPKGVPALATTIADLAVVGGSHREGIASSPETADVTLVLAELDPSVGADHLKTWTDRALVVVTAGRSNAERLRTVGDLLRAARVEFRAAALIRAEPRDDSSGAAIVTPAPAATGREEQGKASTPRRSEAR